MKLNQLIAIKLTKKHHYPSSGKAHRYASNSLKRQFLPEHHDRYYVGDITYIRHHHGGVISPVCWILPPKKFLVIPYQQNRIRN